MSNMDDDDDICEICYQVENIDDTNNVLLFCDSCNICIHIKCYGIKQLPKEDEEWYCKYCIYKKHNNISEELECCLCQVFY